MLIPKTPNKVQTESIESVDTIRQIKYWLEKAVIGLGLCPFAKSVWQQGRVYYAISTANSNETALTDLYRECLRLSERDKIETTLLILPYHLSEFEDFNQFLGLAEALLDQNGWAGIYQIADFHPQYQFAGTSHDSRENWTNRAPFPVLHLLRESSLDKAIDSHTSIGDVPVNNIERLNELDDDEFHRIFTDNKK